MKKTHIKIIEDKEKCENIKMEQKGFDGLLKKASETKVENEDKKRDLKNKKKNDYIVCNLFRII